MAFMCVGLQTSENDQIIPFILLTWPLPKFALYDMTLWRAVCALLELDGFWRGDENRLDLPMYLTLVEEGKWWSEMER